MSRRRTSHRGGPNVSLCRDIFRGPLKEVKSSRQQETTHGFSSKCDVNEVLAHDVAVGARTAKAFELKLGVVCDDQRAPKRRLVVAKT